MNIFKISKLINLKSIDIAEDGNTFSIQFEPATETQFVVVTRAEEYDRNDGFAPYSVVYGNYLEKKIVELKSENNRLQCELEKLKKEYENGKSVEEQRV